MVTDLLTRAIQGRFDLGSVGSILDRLAGILNVLARPSHRVAPADGSGRRDQDKPHYQYSQQSTRSTHCGSPMILVYSKSAEADIL